jgi:hypothetical protein
MPKTVIAAQFASGSGMTDQEAMNQSMGGSQDPASEEHTHTTAVSGRNVTILDSALHEGMKSLTFTILFIPFSIRT